MLMDMVNVALHATEKGLLPDTITRFGIRRLLKQRLREVGQGSCEEWQARLGEFLDSADTAPVALIPERANEQHYEVPSAFFRHVLGPRLKYSCCHWPDGVHQLEQAEEAALKVTCERAGLQDGMDILELGCGWGSLTLWMAKRYPASRITAVSNSSTQKDDIDRQVARLELENVRVITADMNDFSPDEQFDRVVSIEMFEHMRNHRELLRRISHWLKPKGKLFVHIFCHREFTYTFEDNGPNDWMSRHFFSGGIMPGDDLLVHYQDDLKLACQWRWNGLHYAKTCNSWLANMDHQRDAILPLFEETYGRDKAELWFVRWRLFFLACAELFDYRGGDEWWVSHYLFEKHPRLAAVGETERGV